MRPNLAESFAVAATLLGIGAAVALPLAHERRAVRDGVPEGARVITLTAVAATGTWTEEEVSGANYWRRRFDPARPVLRPGETAVLRLKSSDVIHTFYAPGLGVGPVDVLPGHVATAVIRPAAAGVYSYYCTSFCGAPHFWMRGEIVVGTPEPAAATVAPGWLEPLSPRAAGLVERGKALFHHSGCITCHGEGGKGGVPNLNDLRGSPPALNLIAERMMLADADDARALVKAMERGEPLESLQGAPPVDGFNRVLAQYRALRNVIREGRVTGKADPEGPIPPLQMPSWKERLSDADIDALLAYLITQQPW